jgi:two-component system NtrC family sensor kinase
LSVSLSSTAQKYQDLALFTARSIVQQMLLTRRWNALQGGVYVPVTKSVQPNPYLEDPLRDVVTTDGLRLTKLNPAYMTRLIADVMRQEHGMQLHMSSLKPFRPENTPDAWEREALESFERGGKEHAAVSGAGETAVYRYIAPLLTEESCLQCHSRQGYQLKDIRGGIAVSFPYRPFSETFVQHRREAYLLHLLFFGFGLGFIFILGHLLLRRVRDLQESSNRIRRLEGLLPICAGCKKIRVAGGDFKVQASWERIESYIQDRTDAEFTHGMCPECARKYFGDMARP